MSQLAGDLLVPVSVDVIGQVDGLEELECAVDLSARDPGPLDYLRHMDRLTHLSQQKKDNGPRVVQSFKQIQWVVEETSNFDECSPCCIALRSHFRWGTSMF